MSELVKIHTSSEMLSAELLRGLLESQGVDVEMKGEGAGPYRVGQVDLWVPKEHEEAARALVAAVEAGDYALDDDTDVGSEIP